MVGLAKKYKRTNQISQLRLLSMCYSVCQTGKSVCIFYIIKAKTLKVFSCMHEGGGEGTVHNEAYNSDYKWLGVL